MRHTSGSEVCITTVVVMRPGGHLEAEWQHRSVAQALLGGTSRTRVTRPGQGVPRALYLVLSLLLLAGAVFFSYLAIK